MAEVRIRCNVGGSGDRPLQSSGRHNVSTVMVGGPEENGPSSNGHDSIPSNNNEDNMVPQTTEILLAPPESEYVNTFQFFS